MIKSAIAIIVSIPVNITALLSGSFFVANPVSNTIINPMKKTDPTSPIRTVYWTNVLVKSLQNWVKSIRIWFELVAWSIVILGKVIIPLEQVKGTGVKLPSVSDLYLTVATLEHS